MIFVKYKIFFALLCFVSTSFAQKLVEVADLPASISASSGIQESITGNIWTMNDHGKPVLYQLDKNDSFKVTKTVYLNNKVRDWEDLTSDRQGNFYIGDFGNNANKRKDLRIYKITNPDSIKENIYTAEIIRFSLPDQKSFPPKGGQYEFDVEAMIHYNDHIYLFSKSRGIPFTGMVKIYKLRDQPGNQSVELIGTAKIGDGQIFENWITGAYFDEDRNLLALLSHNQIFFFTCFSGDDFFGGKYITYKLDHFSQKEAICFDKENSQFILTDELTNGILGGKVYTLDFPKIIPNCNSNYK
jgi:hypothetical protein